MKLEHMGHKHGGRITEIWAVGHETIRGVADWHYLGHVDWNDGTQSKGAKIPPWAVCFDQANPAAAAEYETLSVPMAAYLQQRGAWHEPKNKRDGRSYRWTPKRSSWTQALD